MLLLKLPLHKLANQLHTTGVNTLVISSQNELFDEKQLGKDCFSFVNTTCVMTTLFELLGCSALICSIFVFYKISSKVREIL